MLLLNMILFIHFMLVVSPYWPLPDTVTYLSDRRDVKKSKKLNYKNDLYLRRAACLGKNGEIVEIICCSGGNTKPWLIILPTKHKSHCFMPDCQHKCYSAIIKLRKNSRKKLTATTHTPPSKDFDLLPIKLLKECADPALAVDTSRHKLLKIQEIKMPQFCTDEANGSPTIAVPEIILELLDLCNFIDSSNTVQFSNLQFLCKMKNVTLNDFLQHLKQNHKRNTNLKRIFASPKSYTCNKVFADVKLEDLNFDGSVTKRELSEFRLPFEEKFYVNNMNYDEYFEKNSFTASEMLCVPIPNSTNYSKLDLKSSTTVINKLVNTYPNSTTKRSDFGRKNNFNIFEEGNFLPTKPYRKIHICSCPAIPAVTHNILPSIKNYLSSNSAGPTTEKKLIKPNENVHSCCCTCKSHNMVSKDNLKNLLNLLLRGPKPVFRPTHCTDLLSQSITKPEKAKDKTENIESYKSGESVAKYIAYIDDKCSYMYQKYKKAQWDYETNITHYLRQKAMTTSLEFTHFFKAVNDELTVLNKEPVYDEKLRRQIKLLAMPGMISLPEMKSNEFEQVLYAMETIYSSAVVGKWGQQTEKVSLNPVIAHAMAHSKSPDELKYYWIEWRKASGKRIRSLFEHYVSLMSLAAQTNGFQDASEMWIRNYETEDFIDTLSILWEEVKPLYMQLHAYVRHKLHGLYGDLAGANETGMIPAHLTGDIWGQNWKNLYHKVMPQSTKYENLDALLRDKITPFEIAGKAEDMFLSLGFSELPETFWNTSVLTKPKDSVMSCEPSAWDLGNSIDFRIKLCAKPTMQDLLDIHHLVALTEYYKEYKHLPYAFRNGPNPGFQEAIAGSIVLSVYTKTHMNLIKVKKTPAQTANINKLMRLALEKVAFIPYSYILIIWRNKVFNGEINNTNYNSAWWQLRSQHQGISPPIERDENDFDVGSKQHIAANQPYIKYFISTILQFQFYEALCKKANFQGDFHNCDITDSEHAGKTLRSVMSMGSSYHWKVAMQELTGARKIDSKPLLRYFEPLYKWLQKSNNDEKVKIGWAD